jgi:hypothetical protein
VGERVGLTVVCAAVGAPVITDEGVVVGPVVAGTPVACLHALSFEIEKEFTFDDEQAKKERNYNCKPLQATVSDLQWAPSWRNSTSHCYISFPCLNPKT